MALRSCPDVWGNVEIRDGEPGVEHGRNILCMPLSDSIPFDAYPHWGLYHENGTLLEAGALRRGAENALVGQSVVLDTAAALEGRPPKRAPDGDYVYGGLLHGHYGHFITTTLPRLWYVLHQPLAQRRIVFHGSPSDFELEFVQNCFEALQVSSECIFRITEPTVVPSLIIPYPAFQEQSFAYRLFAELGHHIGGHKPRQSSVRRERAYITKSKVTSGAGKIIGEDRIEAALQADGFDIVSPETLPFQAQIDLFRSYDLIVGPTGSSLHTSIFSENPCKMLALSPVAFVNSNLLLIDEVNNNSICYVYDDAGCDIFHGQNNFLTSFAISNPDAVGAELVRMANAIWAA